MAPRIKRFAWQHSVDADSMNIGKERLVVSRVSGLHFLAGTVQAVALHPAISELHVFIELVVHRHGPVANRDGLNAGNLSRKRDVRSSP